MASGPFAGAFLTLIIIAQVVEYFQSRKPKPTPTGVLTNQQKIEDAPPAKPTRQARTASLKNSPVKDTFALGGNSSKEYHAVLTKGELLTIEAGAEDWIFLELLSRSGIVERSKEGRNLTIQFEAPRNGNWLIFVSSDTEKWQEVGVTLTVEAS